MKFSNYTAKDIKQIFKDLKTSEKGISEEEAVNRLKSHGFNEIKEKEVGFFNIFLRQFKSPFFYLLFIASLIAFIIGEEINGLMVLFFVFINVFLGFLQETRAEKAVSLLKKYIPLKVRVLREGVEKNIDKKFLTVGDLVLVEAGDIIPADLRILKTENFLIDESVLTGESVPVPKLSQVLQKETAEIFEAKNIAFSGTSVISGKAEGIVINTGENTVLGDITKLVAGIKRKSAYEENILGFSRLILRIVIVTIVVIFLANLIIKGTANFFDFLIFSIALVVSIIPEALPVVITFALSNGALKLTKEKVIIRRLSAIEDLGDVEVLCTDKTGTLTENKLELNNVFSQDKEKCLLYGLLASPYVQEEIESSFNPFDIALFERASSNIRHNLKSFKEIFDISFNPLRLRNSVLLENQERKKILIVRGAPEIILKLSSKFDGDLGKIKKEIEREGREGKRVLAVAFREFEKNEFTESDEKDLSFLGYFSFKDPLKGTAQKSIKLARKLGLKIKIITGDSKEVAGAVAKEIRLIENPEEVITGAILDSLSKEEFEKSCEKFSVFARISPQIKYKIVEALSKKYEVGFLGEGVNDAPALKASHLAIAVDKACDVAREVSDVVLLEKDLKVIIEGIKQGRNIFSNINKYIKCTLASNFGNFYSIALISLLIPFLPMLAIQILLVNLLSDFPLIAVASDKVDVEELKKPRAYRLNRFIPLIILLAIVSTIFDFIFFGIFHKVEPSLLQTLWFIESILTEIILIFSIRTFHFFAKAKMPSISLMSIAVLTFFITVLLPFTNLGRKIFHFVSPPISSLIILAVLIISYFIVSEIVKLIYYKHWQLKIKNQI